MRAVTYRMVTVIRTVSKHKAYSGSTYEAGGADHVDDDTAARAL